METTLKPVTVVAEVEGLMEAEIIKAKLISFGIPAMLECESVTRLYGLSIDGLGKVRVVVPLEYGDESARLLSEPAVGDDEPAPAQE